MPRFVLPGFGAEDAKETAGSFTPYDGDPPPRNALVRVKIKQLKLKLNKNNEPMLNFVIEVNEPKGSKYAKYNTAASWENQNLTKQARGYVNAFLASILAAHGKNVESGLRMFWTKGMNLAESKPSKEGVVVNGMAGMKIDHSGGMNGYVIVKPDKDGVNGWAAASWVVPRRKEAENPGDIDEGDEPEEEIADEPDDEDSGVVEDDADEDDDDGDTEDYADEPPF